MPSASDLWIDRRTPAETLEILGPRAQEIGLARRSGDGLRAARLFIDGMSDVRWGVRAGQTPDRPGARLIGGARGLRLAGKLLAPPSLAAGIEDPALIPVWDTAGIAVGPSAGHLAARLAGGAAAELVLAAAGQDLHAFLTLIPWARRGYWPAGFDRDSGMVLVF